MSKKIDVPEHLRGICPKCSSALVWITGGVQRKYNHGEIIQVKEWESVEQCEKCGFKRNASKYWYKILCKQRNMPDLKRFMKG